MSILRAVAFLLTVAASAAHADQYEFRHYISGLQSSSAPGDPVEPSENWSLPTATLPKAITGEAYSFSFQNLITPGGLEGFSWAGQGIPSWASLNAGTGELTGTPSGSDSGEKSFAITATRAGTDGQQVYTIEVGGKTFEVVQIAAGGHHTCAITTDGGAMCWGDNALGQLGNNSTTNSPTPVAVTDLRSGVNSVSLGDYHTCATTTAGTVKCWGQGRYGQLGNNSRSNSSTPVAVAGLGNSVASISSGLNHTCAVTTAGAAKCWGQNSYSQLGNNSIGDRHAPVAVVGLGSGVASISSGIYHTCAITTAGAAKCWGYNALGQLGDNSTITRSSAVAVVGLSNGVASISAGHYHTCAITTAGAAKCWGNNAQGELGNNSTSNRSTPVAVVGLGSGVVSISSGGYHTCAITTAGATKCWGYNSYGHLGNNSTTNRSTPVAVTGLSNGVASISSGSHHTCAITTAGAARCWGRNLNGQLGNNSTANSPTPVDVLPPAQ